MASSIVFCASQEALDLVRRCARVRESACAVGRARRTAWRSVPRAPGRPTRTTSSVEEWLPLREDLRHRALAVDQNQQAAQGDGRFSFRSLNSWSPARSWRRCRPDSSVTGRPSARSDGHVPLRASYCQRRWRRPTSSRTRSYVDGLAAAMATPGALRGRRLCEIIALQSRPPGAAGPRSGGYASMLDACCTRNSRRSCRRPRC